MVIDMLASAKGCLTASDLLAGLLERPGDDGPALAADVFAAFIAASAAGNGRTAGGDNELGDLRSLVSMRADFQGPFVAQALSSVELKIVRYGANVYKLVSRLS